MISISKLYALLILSTMAISQGAMAQTDQFSACMDKAAGVTSDMLDCIGSETKRQDVRLNKAYKDVFPQLSPARKKQLLDVQRTWIKYRDANCSFYADPDGGTMATVVSNDCFLSATAARAKELENLKE